jgi:hypothetical protein
MKTEDVLSDFQMIGSRIAKLSVKNDLVSLTDEEPFKKQLELSHSIGELSVEDQETLVCPLQLHVKVKIKNGKQAPSKSATVCREHTRSGFSCSIK